MLGPVYSLPFSFGNIGWLGTILVSRNPIYVTFIFSVLSIVWPYKWPLHLGWRWNKFLAFSLQNNIRIFVFIGLFYSFSLLVSSSFGQSSMMPTCWPCPHSRTLSRFFRRHPLIVELEVSKICRSWFYTQMVIFSMNEYLILLITKPSLMKVSLIQFQWWVGCKPILALILIDYLKLFKIQLGWKCKNIFKIFRRI